MKNSRLKLIVLLFASLFFYGCDSDDDPGFEGSLIGDWRMTSIEYEGVTKTEVQSIPVETTFDVVGKNIDVVMTFTDSPNEFVSSGSYDVDLNFTIFGQTTTQTTSIEDFESGGTWSRTGEKLTIDGSLFSISLEEEPATDDIGSVEVTIIELTDTTLKLSMMDTQEFTQDGSDVSVTITSSIEFIRE